MSIMALDVGSKRIGIAIADPTGSFALPIGTIERTNVRADLARIEEYLDSYGVRDLIVGDPVSLSGERGLAAEKMDAFVDQIRRTFTGAIHRIDERLTTAQVTKTLIAADVSRKRRKEVVDKMAAALILDSYLAQKRNAAT